MTSCVRIAFVALVAIAGLSCDAPTEPLPFTSPDGRTPIVTGLRIATLEGPTGVDVWGEPNDFDAAQSSGAMTPVVNDDIESVIRVIPRGFHLDPVYPNPSVSGVAIGFQIPYQTAVSVWIVPADVPSLHFSSQIRYPGAAVVELIREKALYAGSYRYTWDGKDAAQHRVPSGLYRIYFQAGGGIAWRDLLLTSEGDGLARQVQRMLNQ